MRLAVGKWDIFESMHFFGTTQDERLHIFWCTERCGTVSSGICTTTKSLSRFKNFLYSRHSRVAVQSINPICVRLHRLLRLIRGINVPRPEDPDQDSEVYDYFADAARSNWILHQRSIFRQGAAQTGDNILCRIQTVALQI